MKKLACSLLTIIILFTISCEIGLGSSVDTEPPSLSIAADIADKVIRDDFVLRGTYSDDGTVSKLSAVLKRTDKNGEPLEYDGVIIENLKKRGSGTWTIDIPAKSKSIKDGTYQADVSITDSLGRTTVQSTIFTIDNTPPIIILTRPSTALESTSSDTYGQKFTIEGAAAEKNDIGRMEIQLYTDEACTIPAAEEPIVLTNVPSSIEVEAANYDVEQAKYIYKGITQSFFIDVPTDGEGREFYYKLFAYDGAKRYLPEDETPSDDDLKGNRAEYFFLQKDIYENIQQYYTITEMYSILSDNYFESSTNRAAEAPLPEQVKTDLLDDSKYQRSIGKFNLNPKNNPTYTVTGRSPLASLTKSSFENDDNALIIGGQLIIEVSPGLDGHILKEDTIKIYTQQYTFTDGTPVVGTPVEITQYERKESGNTYKYITNINREDGYEIGKFYTVYVEGKDVKNNTIVSAGNNPYGFRLISNGRAPVINLSEPEDVTTYTNKKQIFKGTAEVELGIPVVNVYKGIVSESTKVKTIEFTEEQGYKEGSDFVFDFTYEDETFDGKTGKSKFLFETDLGGQKSTQPQERTVIYDMDLPTISITKPTTAKKFKADGSEEAVAYLNGEVEFTVMLNDKGGSGLDSESNKPKWEIFDASNKTTPLASGFITETTGETISINTAESKYNGKTIIFRVTAWDVAGNKKSTEADDSKYTFIVDQTTDIPFICEDTDYGKVKFSLNSVDAYMAQSAEAKFGTVKKSSTLKFKVYEDDGTANITILKKKLNITKNNDGTYTSDWTNDLSAFDEEEAFEEEIDTPNKLVTMNTYSFPSTDAECGYYEYVIIATDKSDKSASPRNTIKGPFIVRITKDEASITVEKDFDYRNENSEFTNTITIIPSEGPYKLYRQVVVDGEQYNDTSFGNTDIAEYKLIKDNIPDTTLIHEDKLKLSTYAHDKNITVYYKVIDGASQASASQSVVLKYDNAAFAPEIKAPIAGKTGKQALTETTQISARLRDDRAGVEKVFYKFTHNSNPGTKMGTAGGYESEPASNGSFALDPDFVEGLTAGTNQLCEGKWFFHIYTEDGAGNVSAVETREFDIDMKSPVITTTLDDAAISTDAVYNKNAAYTFKFKITETNALDATEPVIISVKKGTTPISFTIKDGATEVSDLTQIAAGKDYTIEIPDADGLYTYTITVKDFVGKDAKVERVVQYDTTPPVAKHEIDSKQKDLYFRIGDYSNDAGDPDVGGKYSGGTYGNALTIQIRGYFDDEGSGINKFYYKTFKDLEVMVDSTKATGSEPVTESETIYFNSPDVLKNYVIANNTGTFFPLDEPEEKNVDYNTAAGKVTKAIVSNYKTTIKGFQEGRNYLVLVAEDNVGNTAVDYAEIEGVGKFYCYSLNVDITSPSIPTKEDENLFTNIDSTNTDSNVHFYIEGTVSDKPNMPNGSAGLASVVFTRDGGTGSIELKANDLTEPTTEDIAAVPDDSTLKHWKVDVKSLLPSSGTAIISAKVTDNAGYEVSVPVANITVDKQNPELSITAFTETKGNVYSKGSGDSVTYFTNNTGTGKTYTISGIATDNSGLQSITLDVENTAESQKPALTTQTINNPSGNWSFTVGDWSSWSTGAKATVTVTDKAGNTASKELNIKFDTTNPVISELKFNNTTLAADVDTSNIWYKSQIIPLSVSLVAQANDSGIASVEWATQTNSQTAALTTSDWTAITTKDDNGNYIGSAIFEAIGSVQKLYIRVTDNAGNVSYFKDGNAAVTINIDTTAPSVIPPENSTFATNGKGDDITVTGSANDTESGVTSVVVTVDGLDTYSSEITSFTDSGEWTASIPSNSFGTGTARNFTIYAAATNKAGITSSLVSVGAISVDSAAPVVEITSPADNTTKIGVNKLIIGGTANDGTGSGLSNESIKVYYTTDSDAGTSDSITTLDETKWTQFGELASAAAWTFTNENILNSITYPGTIVPDNANTELYFTIAVTDKAGNTGYSAPRKIIVDRKLPEINTEPSGFTGSDAWINSNTIALKGSFNDPVTVSGGTDIPGSGINTIYYLVGDTFANAKTIPTTDGNYDTNIQLNTNGSEVNIHIWAKDNAGNVIESLPTENSVNYKKYTISVDSRAPTIESKYFKKGTGELTLTSDSAYVTGNSTITLYGNYADGADESGVNELTFKNNGDVFTPSSILYSTTKIEGTNRIVPADSEYGEYSSSSAKAYKSWKAVFTVNAASRITVEGSDIAGNAVSETVLDIKLDTNAPVVEITSPADNTTKVGAKNFILGGTASDGTGSGIASGLTDVYYTTKADISGITTIPDGGTAPSTISTGTKADEAWVSLGQVNSGTTWTFTQASIENIANDNVNTDIFFTIKIADKAGNVGYAVPRKVTIDRKKPSLKSGTGKINGKTNTSAWFNNRTINLEGTFEDDASGVKYVYYKVGNDEQQLPSDGTYNRNITLGENVNSTTIIIWAEDNAGNKITNEDTNDYQSYTLRIDTTAPVIELESQGIQYSNRQSAYPLTISVSDPMTNDAGDTINASGVDTVVLSSDAVTETSITCELDEEDGKYKAEDIRTLFPNTGNATITIVATDNAGNTRSKTTTIMVDTKEPTVTLDKPANAKGTVSETYVNGEISITGTSYDDNIIDQIGGLCYMVEPTTVPEKPAKGYVSSSDEWTAPDGWTKLDGLSMAVDSNTSKWTFQGLDTNTTEFNDKTVYFTAAVIDKAGNIGYSTPVKVIVDQDSNRPTIKITSMLLDGMTSSNLKGSTESEITGSVSDDDGVPRGLKYSLNGTVFTTDGLVYSTSDGQFTLTLEDGEHTIYFEVETNEEISTGGYKKFTTMASPTDAQLVDTPKLTDRNGTTFGEKGENSNKNTVYYMYIDKEQPEVKDFAYSRTYDAETWQSSISGEYFGGPSSNLPEGVTAKNSFYITQTAKDANGVKKVYLSIPADALDGNSNAVTSWFYQSGSVKKTIYTIGNHPSDSASYWNDFAAVSGTKIGDITSVAENKTSVTIGSETYNRTAYIFALEDTESSKNKTEYHIWKTPEDKPVDVTGLASGEKTASLIAYDGTRSASESKIIWVDNSSPTVTPSAPETVSSSAVVNGSINDGTNTSVTTVSFAVTTTEVTDGSAIQDEAWKPETHAGATQFKINFDGGDEDDAFETHAKLLKQYLLDLGILTENDITNKTEVARQLQPVYIWIKSVDNCNNVGYEKQLVYVDALGNIPTVSIAYPTLNAQSQTLGGTITIMGSAKDNIAPKLVWLQFDVNSDRQWTTDDYELLKTKYQFGNMKYNTDLSSGATVSSSDIGNVGIKVTVDGGSWSKDIDTLGLFSSEDQSSNTIKMWAYASDDDVGDGSVINVSRADTRVFNIDKDNPYFKQDTIKLVQYSTQNDPTTTPERELPYTEGMYIKGIWWIEGEVRDNSAGIKEIKKSIFGSDNQYGSDDPLISTTGGELTSGDYRFESQSETGENDSTIYNYTFKIKVGDTENSGRDRFKIKVKENKPTEPRDAEKEFILYYDNKAPTFATPTNSSDSIATEVKNDNGFYGLHSTAYEKNENDSGIDRVAVFFTRTIGTDTYIFDPMYKRGTKVSNKDVSKITIDSSLVKDSEDDNLYWGFNTIDTDGLNGVYVTLTSEVPSYVHIGGLAKIDDFVYRIQGISTNKKTVTLSSAPHKLPDDNKVYFAVANVVDNTKEEKKPANPTILTTDYGYGYASKFDDDDSDGIMEYLKNIDSTTWNWNLYINSKNIPDGSVTIHYVIFDKAGNTAYNSVNASVENNKPRLVSVKIGRDVNQDGTIATTNPETITYYENGTAAEDKPTLYKNGATTITIPNKITVKSKMEVTPEIVGGNGKIYYKIRKGSDQDYIGYGTGNTAIELMDGNNAYDNADWDNNKDHTDTSGALVTQNATITHDLTASNKVRYQALISQNDSAWSLSYMLYDSKEAGEVNKVYINIPEIDFAVYDEDAPSVTITPFYWKQDGDIKKSSALYEDVTIDQETKTVARGHIDLNGELPTSFDTSKTGVNDRDDKVSGIIKIEGTATDTRKLSALYISIPGMETYFGSDNANLTKKTVNSVDYYKISTYESGAWTDKAGNLANYGFAFQTSGNSLTDAGHAVNWTFTWDTSKISTVTATNVNINVLAEDAASEASASTTTPQNRTTAGNRKVDVVPYITKLVTDISESAGEEFARSATGKYIVKGSYLNENKVATTETVKVYGFNLATTANSKNSTTTIGTLSTGGSDEKDTKSKYLNLAIGTGSSSGLLAITVNDISSLNNVNQNPEFEDGAIAPKANSKAMYNSQANDETNNRLTDDVELVVWDMNYFLNETNITSPMMKMDKSGNYYMSYGEGVPSMYVNKNGTTRQVDYSYNKFHNTNVIYDDNGNIYAVATNTDRVGNESARFAFYAPLIGENMPATIADNQPAYQYSAVTKRHLEQAYNGSTTVYDINRVKQPKLASYTKADGTTYLGVAYYDYNNTINPVKVRFGTRASSYTAISNTEYTFTYYGRGKFFYTGTKLSGAVLINKKYYALDCYNKDDEGDYYYKISGYAGTQSFSSKVYTYNIGGLSGSTDGGTGQSNNPATTDSSASGYHIVASDSTNDFKGGQYAAVGIVPKKTGDTVTGYVGVVAWYDAKASKLCYSYNTDPETAVSGEAWQTNAKYIDTAKYSGWYVDLAVDVDGGIHIAYYNSAKGDLKYVYLESYDADPSAPVTVDSYLSVGTNITVNVRKQGDNCVPYIYYYNASGNQTANSIKVAWQKDITLRNGVVGDKFTGAWECMTVPSANIPVEATVCGGVPTGTHTGTNVIDYSKTVVLGYMTDKYYEKAYIKGDIY